MLDASLMVRASWLKAHGQEGQDKDQAIKLLSYWEIYNEALTIKNRWIRRPLLAKSTRDAQWVMVFLTISGHAFQLSGYVFMSLEGPNTLWICLASSTSQDPFASQKSFYFQTCFQGPQNQKNGSEGLQKKTKFEPEIHKKRFTWKVTFRDTFLAKTSIWKSQTLKSRFRNRYKNNKITRESSKIL